MAAQAQANRWLLKNTHSAQLIEILKSRETSVGRKREAGVSLHSRKVSRTHASLGLTEDDKLWLEDLKSSNGTYVNETRIEAFKKELILPGAKLGFGLPSIQGAEGDKDHNIFWEVQLLSANNVNDETTPSLGGIQRGHDEVSAVVQRGGTFEFANLNGEVIEISDDEDIEENSGKSQNENCMNAVNSRDEPSIEPQPNKSIEEVFDSFDNEITKIIRESNNQFEVRAEGNSVNERNCNEKEDLPNNNNQPESNKYEDKKTTEPEEDDEDMSSSQLFQMSQLPESEAFQRIQAEMAEMNDCTYDPNLSYNNDDDHGDVFDNTQEMVDVLLHGLDDTNSSASPDSVTSECSTEPAKAPPSPVASRKSSRLEARESTLTKKKSNLEVPEEKKLQTDPIASTSGRKLKRRHSSTGKLDKDEAPETEKQKSKSKREHESKRSSRRLTEGDKGKKPKLDEQSSSSSDSEKQKSKSKREHESKRNSRRLPEGDKVKKPKLDEQSSSSADLEKQSKSKREHESKRSSRRLTEGDKSKKPKLDEQSTSSFDKSNEKSVAKGKKESKSEKASEEPRTKHRTSAVEDKSKSPQPEESLEAGTSNLSSDLKKRLAESIKITKVKKPEPKRSSMTLRSNSDSFEIQKVSKEAPSTSSLVKSNGDSSSNRSVDPRSYPRPSTSSDSSNIKEATCTSNSNGDLSHNIFKLPVVKQTFDLPGPSRLESPELQQNHQRRPDPWSSSRMIPEPSFSARVIDERRTGRVAYNNARSCNIDKIITKILNWDTSWLEHQLKSISFEPRVNENSAEKIPLKFRNFEEYFKIFNRLLFLETWDSIFRAYVTSRRTHERLKPQVEVVRKCESFTYLDCFYEFTSQQLQKNDSYKPDDLILIEYNSTQHSRGITFGLVKSSGFLPNRVPNSGTHQYKTKINFTVMVPCNLMIRTNDAPLPRIITQQVANLRTQIIMFKVLTNFNKSPLISMVLCPRINDFKIELTHEKLIVPQVPAPFKLNSQQKTFVLEAASLCTGNKPGIYTLIGPPGTGKTQTIVHILFQIIFDHFFGENTLNKPLILLVAPSNAAVDNLITKIASIKEKLPSSNYKKRIKLVRIGPLTSISKAAQSYTLQTLAERHVPALHESVPAIKDARRRKDVVMAEFCKEYFGKDYQKQLKICENLVMEKSNIILTTLGSCASNVKIIDAIQRRLIHPTCCIIDEATQCHEPESLLPTLLGINKIVMVGDPKQLNATILNKEASKLGFGDSLFSRLANNLQRSRDSPVRLLTTQYRMHPEICKFPNRYFYGGKLECVPYSENKLFNMIHPYLVFNCLNEDNQADSDYTNKDEMRLIKTLLAVIIKVVDDETMNYRVGIIAPYNAQKNLIHDNLIDIKNEHLNWEIKINTVDSFQGSEHDIVIISCVRESTNSFVQNLNRLTVALTRAKQALYIFGNSTLFRECPPLHDLREDARNRKVCLDIDTTRLQSERDFRKYICRR